MRLSQSTSEDYPGQQELTTRERIILLEASKLNGHLFPPWHGPPSPDELRASLSNDIDDLSLSSEQTAVCDGWLRAFSTGGRHHPPSMTSKSPIDLVQDIAADCSIVASLCAASARIALNQSDVPST